MKRIWKGLTIFAAALALGWLIFGTAYTRSISDEITRLRRESRSDIVYLRNCVRELEAKLAVGLGEYPSKAVGGEAEETAPAPETEAVTVPVHKAPETGEPETEQATDAPAGAEADADTAAPAALYLLAEHNGVIGVFDAAGQVLRTINVFVMTLPEAEQEALRVGIPAYSFEEMCGLVEQYE